MVQDHGAGGVVISVDTEQDLMAGLRLLVAMPGPAVVLLRAAAVASPRANEALSWWASNASPAVGVALVAAAQALPALRAIVADLASQGAVVAAFSEKDLSAAADYAVREWQLAQPAPGMQPHVARPRTRPECSTAWRTPWPPLPAQSIRQSALRG